MNPTLSALRPYAASCVLALLLAACSAADGDDLQPASPGSGDTSAAAGPGIIAFGMSHTGPSLSWKPPVEEASRAQGPIAASIPESVGVFGYNNFSGGQSYKGGGEVFNNVQLFWRQGPLFALSGITAWPDNPDGSENQWPYLNPMPWLLDASGIDYKFFAYSPYTAYGTDIEAYGRSYDSFESVVWRHVPKYSASDYVVADRIVEYTSRPSDNDLQVVTMQHLQARIRFCFKLGPEFSRVRMIRVKKIEMVAHHGFLYTLTARYTAVNEGGDIVLRPNLAWSVEEGLDTSDFTMNNEPDPITGLPIDYIELSRDTNSAYQALASLYAYPNDALSAIQIRVTYDVYDYYPESGKTPVLLRENDTAQNSLQLNFRASNATGTGGPRLQAGHYYDVRIVVEPDYLYVLSDNDFDAEGFLVINDE